MKNHRNRRHIWYLDDRKTYCFISKISEFQEIFIHYFLVLLSFFYNLENVILKIKLHKNSVIINNDKRIVRNFEWKFPYVTS